MTVVSDAQRAAGHVTEPAFLRRERRRIEETLTELIPHLLANLDPRLKPAAEYALTTTGKRLRPVLCVLAYEMVQPGRDAPPALYRLACALEIVHTYSLVHDDLPCMDDDDLRRGRPTAHRVFGIARATLAGAALLPLAVTVLEREAAALGLGNEVRSRLVRELAHAAGAVGMVGGQLLDLDGEGRTMTPDELEEVHRRKTAALLTSALRIGAIAGGAAPALLQQLTEYGAAIGVAFQIVDDLLDVEATADDLGKAAGRDVALGKSSYPALHGAEGSRALARSKIDQAKHAVGAPEAADLRALADYIIARGR